ncbi:MAG: hypothetical protein ACXWCQ_32405, partial [Burkholderiales bacterium]
MMITHAIELAKTEHVVRFLLMAYVETLDYYETTRSLLPAQVRRMPLAGKDDLYGRLCVFRTLLQAHQPTAREARRMLGEAVEIFAAASRRLNVLEALTGTPVRHGALVLQRRSL